MTHDAQLRQLVETFESAEHNQNGNYASLLTFSLGRIDSDEVMRWLGLDSEEDLFLLMAQAHLPMPRLDEKTTADMVRALHALSRS